VRPLLPHCSRSAYKAKSRITSASRLVIPILRHGWLNAEGSSRNVPAPFQLAPSKLGWSKGVVLDDYEFSGATARLSPRHVPPSGYLSVEISRGRTPVLTGYAKA